MSVLDTPRVYFRGQITWDPIVTNNYQHYYDLATAKPDLGDGTVADFRERARTDILRGNWNVHGTHRSSFFETAVSGVDLGDGLDVDDALVGVPVEFSGKLVDLDPYGATTSQLFFDQLSCGVDGGSQILARRSWPMVARRINFARNTGYRVIAGVASVIWQTSFPAGEGLSLEPRGSAVLERLAGALAGDDVLGLTVRFNAYRTVYFGMQSPGPAQNQELAERIKQGGFHPNPARSMVVGVIGLWRAGEPPAVPGDRVIARAPGSKVSTAFAKVGPGRLTLDLANSVPETGFDLGKLDLGPLTVVAKAPGADVELGTLDYAAYDAAAYAATSGIVSLPLDDAAAAAAEDGDLEVRAADGTPVLTEQPLTVAVHPPNVYLEEGESTAVTLRVFRRGRPPGARVSITMAEVPTGGPLPHVTVETDARGEASVPVTGDRTGSWTWVLAPWEGSVAPPPPTQLTPDSDEYLVVRTTPADDDIGLLAPSWDNVHTYVLRDWEAMAPCMDNWLLLGDEDQCARAAALVRDLTSRERFDDYGYMPVTRDLTKGQRTLLHRWCDLVIRAGAGGPPAAETIEAAAAEPVTAEPAPERNPFGRGF